MTPYSSESSSSVLGTAPAASNSCPCGPAGWRRRRRRGSCSGPRRPARSASARCTTSTPPASRPSRRRPARPAGASAVPFGPTTTAAAAWSWVEKMLQETQRTSAPSATRVSISTAVCTVMCSEPAIRAPRSGWLRAELLAQRHQAGHLVLGEPDLVAAELGQREVGDLVVARCVAGRAAVMSVVGCSSVLGSLRRSGVAGTVRRTGVGGAAARAVGGARRDNAYDW